MKIFKPLIIFLFAALLEIGGGYLVWQWLKNHSSILLGIFGLLMLCLYGVVATWQIFNFTRVYAGYGGIFIIMSLIWGCTIDGFKLDKFDIFGAFIILIGVSIIIFTPRK